MTIYPSPSDNLGRFLRQILKGVLELFLKEKFSVVTLCFSNSCAPKVII
jgi:hypothetical protein